MMQGPVSRWNDAVRPLLRRRAPALLLALLLVAGVALALGNPGVPTTRVDVNDGGIWVTNDSRQLVGHLNYASRTLDAALRSPTTGFEIAQYRDTVTYTDPAAHSIAPVDAAAVRLGAATSLPERSQVAQGGERLGILDQSEGRLWVAAAAQPADTPVTEGTALASDLAGGVVTAGVDGTVVAVAARASRFAVVSPTASGQSSTVTSVPITGLKPTARLSVTMVGSRPVALDSASNTLVLPDGRLRELSVEGVATGGILQQPGPEADHVLIATPSAVVSVPLSEGAISQRAAAASSPGRAAAPVRLNGCEYAAWAGSGVFQRWCDGVTAVTQRTLESLQQAGTVQFRTNRDLIVLNDTGSGTVWLPDKDMVLAADWDEIENQVKADEDTDDSPQTTDEIADPERKSTNTPPVLKPDSFGVRPGRATTLDVLGNDSDSDGDILTARPVTQPSLGKVVRSRGGQALRLAVPDDATGRAGFTYEGSDGRSVGTAAVEVEVHPWSQNAGPEQRRRPVVKLGAGAEVSYNVLPDWRDPDGDAIFLADATGPDHVEVQFRKEGTVTVRNLGAAAGPLTIDVVVSDGTISTEGRLNLSVQATGNLAPVANGDFYVTTVGEEVLLQPLANDTDPNNDSLTMVRVSPAPEAAVAVPDLELGTVTFKARTRNTYYLTYSVTDGPAQSIGVIRIDVVDPDQSAAVVAEDDLVLLPAGGAALAAPLDNDTDPSGGVLVVQSVTSSEDAGLKVTLVDHHLLRVTSLRPLEKPASITYTASNGVSSAQAKVLVVPTDAEDDSQAPVLQPDRATVRVGDIASASVLTNDRSPAGLRIWVDGHLEYNPDPAVGTPFVTGNQVRIEAGTEPGFLRVAYTVRDSAGNLATSTVLFEVKAADATNTAPRPQALTAWAVSGQTVRIPVPLADVDPDGDSVTLVGIDQSPQKGTALLGTDWLEYTPGEAMTGSDVFTYLVEDRLGKQATARVRVGIAPPSAINQSPSAVKDTLLVRPGRTITVPVLENDLDPDGDRLALAPAGLATRDPRLAPRIEGTAVVVTTPDEEGSYLVTYEVLDGRGGSDVGALTLNVAADAPPLAPQARDDVVPADQVPSDGSPVTVDVVANDADPDGDFAKLVVATRAEGVRVVGGKLAITPDKQRRLVVYSITDQDGLVGQAVVSVPGTERTRPRLDETKVPVEVRAGQEVSLDLNDFVLTRDNRSAHVNDPTTVRASIGSDGDPQVPDDHTIVFRAAKEFAGDTAVSFQVSDGTGEDRSALTVGITIPIRVIASVNHPPRLTPTVIEVAMGEPARAFDLTQMVTDPDQADPATFEYTLVDGPDDVSARLEGTTLKVEVQVDHAKGPAGRITIGVDDGSGVVTTEIPVVVLSSTRRLVQVSDARVDAANAGTTVTIDIREYTDNPFDEPLRIVKPRVLSGEVRNVSGSGTILRIVLREGFHGLVVVAYGVMDATNDQSRMVEGRVTLVVRDRPEPPTGVAVSATGAGEALVTFQPGANNGAPITHFVLTDETTGERFGKCLVASCPVKGLENGIKHAFSVVAFNDVGGSDPSATSEAVLIDVQPGRPNPPKVTAGDQSITVTWSAPTNQGSAIQRYRLHLRGGTDSEVTADGRDTSRSFSGLRNGEAYRVSIQAENKSGMTSDNSEFSDTAVPFGRPDRPADVSVELVEPDSPSMAKARVSWAYPRGSNGRPWDAVRVEYDGGSRELDSDGSVTSTLVEVPVGQNSPLRVALHTEGGWSDERSMTFQAASVPVAIDPPTVRATGRDGEVSITGAERKGGNGYLESQLRIQYSTGGDWRDLSGSTVGGLANGRKVTFAFRQAAQLNGLSASGRAVAVDVTPYGPPLKPSLTASAGNGQVTFRWESAADNGGPRVTRIVLTVNGATTESADLAASRSFDGAAGQQFTGTVAACYADGTCTESDRARAMPWGTVQVRPAQCRGGEDPGLPDGSTEECHSFQVQPEAWEPQVPLHCTFDSDIDGRRRGFDIRSSGWSNTGQRTAVTEAKTMNDWIGTKLICRP